LIIHSFYNQRESVTFQRVQAVTILRQAVVAAVLGLMSFQVFHPSPCMHDLLCATGDGFRF
jgi:protein-S-isoprenylcysteine O-methyltransferase Ste14